MFDCEPFGQRAVRLELATSEQVRLALETQAMMAQKSGLLGEILVEMGWLDAQDYLKLVQDLVKANSDDSNNHDDLQEVFVAEALKRDSVSRERLEEAKTIQANFTRKNRLIGQVMVEMGFITADECKKILKTYSGT